MRARGPPHRDVGLDLLELLEGAVDVERIELVGRDTVGHQRRLQRGDRVIAQRAAARELLHVPEIGPAIGRGLGRVFLLTVGQHARIELVGHRIRGTIGLGHRGAVRQFREIEFFEQALLAAAQAIAGRHVDHVPGRLAAGDLRFDRGPGVGDAVLVDGDAKLLGGGIEDRDGLRLLVGAALGDEGDLVAHWPEAPTASRGRQRKHRAVRAGSKMQSSCSTPLVMIGRGNS